MDFELSSRSKDYLQRLGAFMDEHVYPAEHAYHQQAAANTAAGDPFRTPEVLTALKPIALLGYSRGLENYGPSVPLTTTSNVGRHVVHG